MTNQTQPLADRILVTVFEEEEVSPGGIILAAIVEKKQLKGKVASVGKGRVSENGKEVIPLKVKAGDKIIFTPNTGTELTINKIQYLILKESDILAIV